MDLRACGAGSDSVRAMGRGRFIALEGIDGSGTTSQRGALAAALEARGHSVLQTCEPSEGSIGRMVRSRLASNATPLDRRALALMFAADRLDHVATEIEPALAAGRIVLTDRYVLSSWAYQSLDCPLSWVQTLNEHAPWPDLTLVLDVPADVAMQRVAARRGTPEIYETTPMQRTLAESYTAFAHDASLAGVRRIDGTPSQAEVTAMLIDACTQLGL